jgi:lysophospholipase L1-like esterase
MEGVAMEDAKDSSSRTLHVVRKVYRGLALIVLNTIVAVIILNLALVIHARWKEHSGQEEPRIITQYGMPLLRQAYTNMSEEAMRQMLKETYTRNYEFEPFTQFKERPFSGRFVNVDEAGFRRSADQGPWPVSATNFNIFLFGGSTMFGYGVTDDETVASGLQAALAGKTPRPCKVYNFGRGHYYSAQERILFEQLLSANAIPDMVLFMDGMNDFHRLDGKPYNWGILHDLVDHRLGVAEFVENSPIKRWFPVVDALNVFNTSRTGASRTPHLNAGQKGRAGDTAAARAETPENKKATERIVKRYLRTIKMIDGVASAYGIKAVFVWQPVPTYKYDISYHLFAGPKKDFQETEFCRYGHEYLKDLLSTQPAPTNFLWCSDMQENLKESLYVDKLHYSAWMSDLLAQKIASMIVERHLVGSAAPGDEKAR